jgi:DNA-binding transcriptional MerR regulator
MMDETRTLTRVADDMGIPANTIKTWLHQMDFIPAAKDSAGRWRFNDEAAAVLGEIQALRLEGCTLNTVRRRLNGRRTIDEHSIAGVPEVISDDHQADDWEGDEHRSTADERPTNITMCPQFGPDTAAIVEAVTAAIVGQTDMAEKYARAAHRIGELEATVKAVEGERDRDRQTLEAERDRLVGELAAARALLSAPAARSWWKWWG